MKYNFDEIIERRGSGALKYDALRERYGNADLFPMWVADMDFATPSFIIDAMKKRLEHPIFGYTIIPPEYWKSIQDWVKSHHNWEVKREWLNFIPGIVKGIGMVINLFSNPGDKVIIQPPVYHIFRMTVEGNKREVVNNPLIEHADGSYSMNLDELEALAAEDKAKILILSNPHNPAGIVWDAETLKSVADICCRHNVLVISDEIHCDMILWRGRHIPFATVSEEAQRCSITFQAPSKTFNIAGIVSSYAIVINQNIRKRFYGWLDANELSEPTVMAPIATIAAYTLGNHWREQMLNYIEGNIEALLEYFANYIPAIKPLKPQASFMVWLDCRALGLNQQQLVNLFENGAGLALNDGAMFGPGGEGFMRMNVGLPRQLMLDSLTKLRKAITEI